MSKIKFIQKILNVKKVKFFFNICEVLYGHFLKSHLEIGLAYAYGVAVRLLLGIVDLLDLLDKAVHGRAATQLVQVAAAEIDRSVGDLLQVNVLG